MLGIFMHLLIISLSATFIFMLVRPPAQVIQDHTLKKKSTLKLVKPQDRKYLNHKLPLHLQHKQII